MEVVAFAFYARVWGKGLMNHTLHVLFLLSFFLSGDQLVRTNSTL